MIVSEGNSKAQYENVAAGTHAARCVRCIDLGTQKSDYQGEIKMKRQVLISFELPNTKMEAGEYAGQPFMVSKFYTASLGERANLRKDLETWRGKKFSEAELKAFDLSKLLGAPCMLSVVHNEKGNSKVSGIMAVPQGMTVPPQVNPSVNFSFDQYDEQVFQSLSNGVKSMIMLSPEYQLVHADTHSGQPQQDVPVSAYAEADSEGFNNDIPF